MMAEPFAEAAGERVDRALSFFVEMAAVHPAEPHWYLEGLGTHPDWQRRGIASAVLAPVLDLCDADGLPAYLETQKESNVPFYRRHGFEVIGTKQIPDGAPNIWLMWRDIRSAGVATPLAAIGGDRPQETTPVLPARSRPGSHEPCRHFAYDTRGECPIDRGVRRHLSLVLSGPCPEQTPIPT